jgi:hypothetical protein
MMIAAMIRIVVQFMVSKLPQFISIFVTDDVAIQPKDLPIPPHYLFRRAASSNIFSVDKNQSNPR